MTYVTPCWLKTTIFEYGMCVGRYAASEKSTSYRAGRRPISAASMRSFATAQMHAHTAPYIVYLCNWATL